tara:strand:- start:336 stop:554 length:219 start_codon:yes stop_codon:yes gene_type:complete
LIEKLRESSGPLVPETLVLLTIFGRLASLMALIISEARQNKITSCLGIFFIIAILEKRGAPAVSVQTFDCDK